MYPHFVFACLPSIACVRVGHLRLEVCGRVEARRCFVIVGSISISILRVMFVHWILGVGLYIQRKFYGVVLVVLVDIYTAGWALRFLRVKFFFHQLPVGNFYF